MSGKTIAIEVLCDFDGTITNDDIGFRMIETFAGPGWHEIEEAYQRGEKGSREALDEIFRLTNVSEETLAWFVDTHFYVDPHFTGFLDICRQASIAVTVLSDGFDFYIDRMFQKFNVDVPYLANRLRVVDCTLRADYPYNSAHCGACGNCKVDYARKVKDSGARIIYIGDGFSDRCVSRLADVVFAKGHLADYCRERDIRYYPFRTFDDIVEVWKNGLIARLRNMEGKD